MTRSLRTVLCAVLLATPATASVVQASDSSRLIGLLEIPALNAPEINSSQPAVPVYSEPSLQSPVKVTLQALYDAETREYEFEEEAATVYAKKPGWFEIGLKNGRGWVHESNTKRFHSVESLVRNHLTYLTADWDGKLWTDPLKRPQDPVFFIHRGTERLAGTVKADTDVVDSQAIRGELWLKLKILGPGRCVGHDVSPVPPEVVQTGWVPFQSATGKLNVWFFSRGC